MSSPLVGVSYRQLALSSTVPTSLSCREARTTADIIWGCLSAIILCTWTSIHPNVPSIPRSHHQALVFWDRAKVLFVALIAPELIVLWSIRQWFAARKMAKAYQKYGWTMTHAFFALMGGFAFHDSEGEFLFHLWDDRFCEHFKKEQGWDGVGQQQQKLVELLLRGHDKPYSSLLEYCVANKLITITEQEIWSLSRTDSAAKVITIFQTLQFIVNCIARGVNGLAITELEFLTLGFASLNLASYSIWWYKPAGVKSPVRVMDRPRPSSIEELSESPKQEGSTFSLIDAIPALPSPTRSPGVLDAFAQRIRDDYYGGDASPKKRAGGFPKLHLILVVPFLAVMRLFSYAFSGDAAHPSQPERGNLFSTSTIDQPPLTYALAYSTAVLLGVFHCIPVMLSYRYFPDHPRDHKLWTLFALMMTGLPLIVGVVHVVTHLTTRERTNSSVPLKAFFVLIFFLAYSTARIASLVLAVKQLADLPPAALQKAEWTDLIPHFVI